MLDRAVAGCEKIFTQERGNTSLIVTHMVIVRVLLVHYLGLSLEAYREIPVPNASPILLCREGQTTKVEAPFPLPKSHEP